MEKQKQQIHECIDGRCPVGIDRVSEIGLSPLEKRAIFFVLKKEIDKAKEAAEVEIKKPELA
jgi:hypothetical protein